MSEVRAGSSEVRVTATDELRRMLDERGVMHGYVEPDCVWWEGEGNGVAYEAIEVYVLDEPSGYFAVRDLTPQQAIDATLGRGTCRDLAETPDYRYKTQFECSECGYEYSSVGGFGCDYGDEPDFRYCPNCGRKVVNDQ